MTTSLRNHERGSALVEFTLVGLGLLFVLICIFEMARGMWIYHTLAHVSKETTRFLIVHGKQCQSGATCLGESTLGTMVNRIGFHGVGLMTEDLDVQVFRNGTQVVGSGGGYVRVANLAGSAAVWDTSAVSGSSIQVAFRYPFRSALALLWPGAGKVSFTMVSFGASSWDTVQY